MARRATPGLLISILLVWGPKGRGLVRSNRAPFSCAVAGDAYEAMKLELEMLLNIWPDEEADEEATNRFHDALSAFASKY